MKRLWTITDCQFGSTGKGLLAGFLAQHREPDTVATAWGPNAGHTFIDGTGRVYVHTMLANGVVSPALKRVMIGPGSVINEEALMAELLQCADHLDLSKVYIHPHAAVVEGRHRDEEHVGSLGEGMLGIGSTQKGTGAAVIQRIKRMPGDMNVARVALRGPLKGRVVSVREWMQLWRDARVVQLEGAQGFSLSMYHGFYPYTTSRDVSTHQMLADCGVPYGMFSVRSYGTCRTYPIRVSNRHVVTGQGLTQVGWSGPCYEDQEEITFESIGQKTELTTVTKRPRRIFTYSKEQVEQAVMMCGIDEMFVNFMNYGGGEQVLQHVSSLCRVSWVGYGPSVTDVREYLTTV